MANSTTPTLTIQTAPTSPASANTEFPSLSVHRYSTFIANVCGKVSDNIPRLNARAP
jgi:hypothetical protein